MKKLLLSLVAVSAFAFSSQAQTEKGKIMVGGNVAFDTKKTDASGAKSNTNFQIVPSVGYFVADNFAVGTGIGYGYSKTNGIAVADGAAAILGNKNSSFIVSPFGRYYANLSESFKFFGQLSVPMAFGKDKAVDANGNTGAKTGTTTEIGVALSPGFAFYPTKKIGIEFALNGLNYNNLRKEDGNGNKVKGAGYDEFSFGANFFSPKLGIQLHF
ncbi:outer membrane beta-barrel protein [Pedobacter caeni]|uniref:Outer membrane protein beta-barrel domain-containing protein n=1 Tax=Pedobacter caeni TaxID=288992 RepID=A0A1M5H2G7_9SPHI|nr:outer membrane beta-barrel protein [Pedobacter caeni]SHG10056.1 Outer membrane protein beta-barrel domain-containing protein [Pedobacter caeni]